ncbi:hypothetical protein ACVWZL_006074 [Bradyrhizobium sp. GM2.4]
MMKVMPSPALKLHQFALGAFAQLLVQRCERLIEQKELRASRQCTRQRHALALSPGELVGLALLESVELHQRNHLRHTRGDVCARHTGALQAEGDVVAHRQVRKQRVVLEHHVDRPLMRQRLRDVLAAEQNAPLIRRFETGEHAQKRGLAAAAGPEQRKELAGLDVERDAIDGPERPERLGDALDAQQRLAGRELRLSDRSRSRVCSGQLVSHGSCQPQSSRTLAADRPSLNRLEAVRSRIRHERSQRIAFPR